MALQLDKKVYAAAVALVLATTGINVAVNDVTLKSNTKTIIKKYIKTTDSLQQVANAYKFSHFQRTKIPVYDTNGTCIDTVRAHQPAEVVYRPLYYTVPANVFRVEITDTLTDSTWYVAYIQSDSTGLLDVTARIQPSKNPNDTVQ